MGIRLRDLGLDKNLERSRPEVTGAGAAAFDAFVQELAGQIDDPAADTNDVVREVLADLYLEHGAPDLGSERLSTARRAAAACYDPRNITLESEYYADVHAEKFAARKPLIWLWIMFDRSPLGHNVALGTRVRKMLAKRVFKHCGDNVRIFRDVEFTYGYNLSVGDDVIIHHHVFIDDRGEIVIGDRVSLSDYVNVYSHWHHIEDIEDVTLERTEIGNGARVTYHSTILPGIKVGRESMIGAHAVVTRDVPDYVVWGGVPARELRRKRGYSGPEDDQPAWVED